MTAAVAALLAVALNESFSVPPGKWIAVPLPPVREFSRVECEFMLMSTGAGIRAVLVPQTDAARFDKRMSGFSQKGRVVYEASPGRYALVLDNRLEEHFWAEVNVRVAVTRPPEPVRPQYLSPRKRAAIIALSFVFLVAVFGFTGRRLWHAMARRGQGAPRGPGVPPY